MQTRIIPGLAASLLLVGVGVWICGSSATEAGGPPVRRGTDVTPILIPIQTGAGDFPRTLLIPTRWDASSQLLPTEINAQTLLISHINPLPGSARLAVQKVGSNLSPVVRSKTTYWRPSKKESSSANLVESELRSHLKPAWESQSKNISTEHFALYQETGDLLGTGLVTVNIFTGSSPELDAHFTSVWATSPRRDR